MEKTFCCFCCASPPLCVDVRAPVSGYCPGQVIPITIDIENKSNVQLHLVKIFLRKVCILRKQKNTKKVYIIYIINLKLPYLTYLLKRSIPMWLKS